MAFSLLVSNQLPQILPTIPAKIVHTATTYTHLLTKEPESFLLPSIKSKYFLWEAVSRPPALTSSDDDDVDCIGMDKVGFQITIIPYLLGRLVVTHTLFSIPSLLNNPMYVSLRFVQGQAG